MNMLRGSAGRARPARAYVDKTTAVNLVSTYKAALEVPFRGVAMEALAWSVPGLLHPRRPGHPRRLLLFFAALNVSSVYFAMRSIRRDPELLLDRRYLLMQGATTWLRYVLYAGMVPKRTYWRGRTDNQAFFSQPWWPIALWGLGLGPQWSLRVAPLHSYAFYLAAAWANGEPLVPPREVRRNIFNYCNTTIWAGVVCTLIFRTLKKAAEESANERLALAARLAAQNRADIVRELARTTQQEVTRSLIYVRNAARAALPSHVADEVAEFIDDVLARPWAARSDETNQSAFAIVNAIGLDFGVQVRTLGSNMLLSGRSSAAVEALAHVVIDNARQHGGSSEILVTVRRQATRVSVRFEDNGDGLVNGQPQFSPNHGLTRTRDYLRDLGGDLTISSTSESGVVVDGWWIDEAV